MSVRSFLQTLNYNTPAGMANMWDQGKGMSARAESRFGGSYAGVTGGREGSYSPMTFAALVQDATKPGGILSELNTQRGYGETVGGIWDAYDEQMEEQMASLQRYGANPMMIKRMLLQERGKTQERVSRATGEMRTGLEENRFGAMQSLANAIRDAEVRNQQISMWRKGMRQQGTQFKQQLAFGVYSDAAKAVATVAQGSGGPPAGAA